MQLTGQCGHCGMYHGPICPRIKAIEYYEWGGVKRVEYWGTGQSEPQPNYPVGPFIGPNTCQM